MGEKEKQRGSCTVDRSGTKDTKEVKNRLVWMACAATRGHDDIWALLQPRAMSGTVVLLQQGLC